MPRELRTARMLLRALTEADLDWLTALHGDPTVMRYVGDGRPVPPAVVAGETLPRFLGEYADRPAGLGHLAAIGEPDLAPLGWFCLRPPSSVGLERDSGALEIGYRLFPSAWGRGYATEGARALVGFAFGALGADRVVATTMTANVASRRVLEKAGLTLVRTFFAEWPGYIEGAEQGDVVYAASRQDWREPA